jgi:hypothetical protein
MSKKQSNPESEEINVTNIKLRNYFQNRIEEREPKLILKQKQGNYSSYSRLCQSSESRQPVIVTKEQMEKIREEYPEYNDPKNYIEYGTDPNTKYTYICPKYWNMKTNKPISETEMEKKNLSKFIIPRNAKNVPANAYIYEFTNEKGLHYNYPNFIPDRHPDGFCLPCCFKDYDTAKRKEVRGQCMQQVGPKPTPPPPSSSKKIEKEQKAKTKKVSTTKATPKSKTKKNKKSEDLEENVEEAEADVAVEEEAESEVEQTPEVVPEKEREEEAKQPLEKEESKRSDSATEYIKGPDKFPLEPNRWGYLPVGLQKLLDHDNTKCQISSTNSALKMDHPCLLRHGIAYNPKQSFLECIADVYEYSLSDLKEGLVDFLELDVFLMMQNGNLATDFFNDPNHQISEESRARCKASDLYKRKMNPRNKDHFDTFNRSCISYDIFIEYLRSSDTVIDHTYMWDIVSSALKLSLCIFEIPDDDITDNVDILCPTNHYTKTLLASKYDDVAILVKKHDLYEPIYLFTRNKKGTPTIERVFSKKNPSVDRIITILKRIEKFMQDKCRPVNIYNMKPPIHIKQALDVLKPPNYNILAQIINYNSRIIGLFVEARIKISKNEYERIAGMVPVQPTGLLDKVLKTDVDKPFYRQIHMSTDPDILNSYETTIEFYNNLCKNTRGQIPCKLIFKVVEDEHVVGFITETNQFVMIDPPIPLFETIDDGIDVLDEIIAPSPSIDRSIAQASSNIDNPNKFAIKRMEYVDKLKQDSEQYIIFRNAIKILLKNNKELKETIRFIVGDPNQTNKRKTEDIIDMLKDLSENKIHFVDQKTLPVPLAELNIRNYDTIILKGSDNAKKYYYKIANDMIRNTRLREYMLSSSQVVVEKDDYDVNLNEIIINESMILDYYDDLTPEKAKPNKYTSYDETQPGIYKQYENIDHYSLYESEKTQKENCSLSTTPSKLPKILSQLFSVTDNQLVRFTCSYGLIQSLIPEKTTIDQLRLSLINEYKRYEEFTPTIIRILRRQGKKRLIEEMLTKGYSLEDIILSTNYYLTTLDIWLLCIVYTVPCVLISTRKDRRSYLMESVNKTKSFLLYGNRDTESFSFVVVPGKRLKKDSLRLIQNKYKGNVHDSYFYEPEELKPFGKEQLNIAIENSHPVEVMLQNFADKFNRKDRGEKIDDEDEGSDDEDTDDSEEEDV